MKQLFSMLILFFVMGTLSGCIIRTHGHHHNRGTQARSCPPAYHWNGAACVHNGRGQGNGSVRDHRR
jgi:hypothetical protein